MKNGIGSNFKKLFEVFAVFLKIGLFTFGGGYAMISLLESEIVNKRKWISSDEFFKIVAISESTPGPIAINCATYIGYSRRKLSGAAAATFGVVLPSFAIIYVVSLFFNDLLRYEIVANAFGGIKAGVAFLIFLAGIKLFGQLDKKPFEMILLSLTVVANLAITIFAVDFSAIYMILIGGVCGLFAYFVARGKEKSERGFRSQPDKTPDDDGRDER